MDFHYVNMIGNIWVEEVATLPTWKNSYRRRIIYNFNDNYLYYGGQSGWQRINDLGNHISDYNNPHQLTPSQISALPQVDLDEHAANTDMHGSIGYYSRYHSSTTGSSICTSRSGAGWSTNTWVDVEFDTLNDQYNNSEVSYSNGEFTLAKDYLYEITFEAIDRKGNYDGLGRQTVGDEENEPDPDRDEWPYFLTAIKVESGDSSQTLNYGSGEGGSNNTAVIIGSNFGSERYAYDGRKDATYYENYGFNSTDDIPDYGDEAYHYLDTDEYHDNYDSTFYYYTKAWHRNVKCWIKPSSETKIKVVSTVIMGYYGMYLEYPSISFNIYRSN